MKDNFSTYSKQYSKYRPTYPPELFDYIDSLIQAKDIAWDCGTGNGQVAFELAKTFNKVFATDISKEQIKNAVRRKNIEYSVQAAEQTVFEDQSFDLIVVAQAIHWFDFEKFYAEVRRTAKKNALICVIGYARIKVSSKIDDEIKLFYENIIGPYWDKERKYIDENYQTIPFPFDEIKVPEFTSKFNWTLEQLIGYLNTWSAVKHFINANGTNPVDDLKIKIKQHWRALEVKEVCFPILARMGRIG